MYTVTDVDLETRDTTERALRGTHFGGIIGERGDAVAETYAHVREDVASQLHTIAAVTREAHNDALPELDFRFFSFFCHFFVDTMM